VNHVLDVIGAFKKAKANKEKKMDKEIGEIEYHFEERLDRISKEVREAREMLDSHLNDFKVTIDTIKVVKEKEETLELTVEEAKVRADKLQDNLQEFNNSIDKLEAAQKEREKYLLAKMQQANLDATKIEENRRKKSVGENNIVNGQYQMET